MEPTPYIWLNGKFINWEEARLHALTHTLHYGAGAFEGIRAYPTAQGSAVFRIEDHLARLLESCAVLRMQVPFTQDDFSQAICKLLALNQLDAAYIRPIVFFGYGVMGLSPVKAPVEAAIACWRWGAYLAHELASIKISPYRRIHPETTRCAAKLCGHYLNSILANQDAKADNFDEALLLDHEGNIAEGSAENFFMVKDQILYTPSLGSILPGITRTTIIEVARDMGFQVVEKKIRPEEALKADEAFFTGTAAEVSAIGAINHTKIGNGSVGPITRSLKEVYQGIVHGEIPGYRRYLTALVNEQSMPLAANS